MFHTRLRHLILKATSLMETLAFFSSAIRYVYSIDTGIVRPKANSTMPMLPWTSAQHAALFCCTIAEVFKALDLFSLGVVQV